MWQEENNASIQPLSGSVILTLNCVYACTLPDLPVADQRMLLNLWHSFYQVFKWFMCEKTARPIFMQLEAV
jgi:hypothetical protein